MITVTVSNPDFPDDTFMEQTLTRRQISLLENFFRSKDVDVNSDEALFYREKSNISEILRHLEEGGSSLTFGRKRVTVNSFTRETEFHFHIVDVWPGLDTSINVFVRNPTAVVTEMLNHLSMWGGATRMVTDLEGYDGECIGGWEIHKDQLMGLITLADRTKFVRPKDKPEAWSQLNRWFCDAQAASLTKR